MTKTILFCVCGISSPSHLWHTAGVGVHHRSRWMFHDANNRHLEDLSVAPDGLGPHHTPGSTGGILIAS